MKKAIILLALVLLLASASAWFNDTTGNDTCLVAESDKAVYRPNAQGEIFVEYKITNNCGKALVTNVAEFLETRHINSVETKKIEQATTTDSVPIHDIDGKITRIEQRPVYHNINPTASITGAKDFNEKTGFLAKGGYSNISIPIGESYLKTTMAVPLDDGEWALTIVDRLDDKIFSILDPTFTGAGSEGDPYILTTCSELNDIRSYCFDPTIYFELGNDIDCSGFGNWAVACDNGDNNWFSGHLDGANYAISGLTVNSTTRGGIFGYLAYSGSVKNLGLIDFNIWSSATGGGMVGALSGACNGCNITNVYVSGGHVSTATNVYVGGLVGYADVSGDGQHDSNITNVFVDGTSVRSDSASQVGGVMGRLTGWSVNPSGYGTLKNSYSTAAVIGASSTGGIVGATTDYIFVSDNFWDTQTSGQATSAVGTGKTTAEMKQEATFTNWDFDNIWTIEEDVNYPTLQSFIPPPDSTPPVTTVYDVNNTWQNTDANIQFSCSDDDSGCKNLYYSLNDDNHQMPINGDGNVGIVLNYDNNFAIWFWSGDTLDNNETGRLIYAAIDKTPPITIHNETVGEWHISDFNLTFACSDINAGCKNLYYSVDDTNYQIGWGVDENYGHLFNTDGNFDVFFWSDDNSTGVGDNNGIATYLNIGLSIPVFSDLNLFKWNDYLKNADLNIFSDYNIVFDFNMTMSNIDQNSITVLYNVSHAYDDDNCFGTLRFQEQCGWRTENTSDLGWNLLENLGTSYHFRSGSEDDHAFKHWCYNLDPEEFETKDSTFVLDNQKDWAKVLLTGVGTSEQPTDSNVFLNLSFSANFTGTSKTLSIWDCNSDVATPVANPNCVKFLMDNSKPKDEDNYYSILNITNDHNQMVGDKNVLINSDRNHWVYFNCPQCSVGNNWAFDTINQNSNIDRTRNWTSQTDPANLVAFTNTLDVHYHWQVLGIDHNFNWIIQVSDNLGNDTNSEMQTENVQSVNVPPLINRIETPDLTTGIAGIVDLNISVSDPNSDLIVCDINLLNSAQTSIAVLGTSLTVYTQNCGIDFNSLAYDDGEYYFKITVRETAIPELFSITISRLFTIDNLPEPPFIKVPTQRYLSQSDSRAIDDNRFLSSDELRKDDTARFVSGTDTRAAQIGGLDGYNFTISETGENPLILYVTIGVILMIATVLMVYLKVRR